MKRILVRPSTSAGVRLSVWRLAIVAAAMTMAVAPIGAQAETSGWSSKIEPPDGGKAATKPAAPKPALQAPAAKVRPAAPTSAKAPADTKGEAKPDGKRATAGQNAVPGDFAKVPPIVAKSAATPAPPSNMPLLQSSLPPPVGETAVAAYEFFDQGRYLTALQTAVKVVQKTGEREAYTLIGRIYEEGLGVGRNDEVATEWYAQGAELGDPNAQFALGLMYAEGRGAAKNLGRASAAFEAAAKQGHAVAQYNLGMIYAHGEGRDENFPQAAYWLLKAAEQGHAPAQYDLATLYYEGRGVEVDEAKAVALLAKAADAGLPAAALDYARMLAKGEGVAKDERKAFHYIRQAALKGNVVAQNRLARFYFFGVVVDGDIVEGAKWHLLARSGGVADLGLDALLAKMPADKRQKAEVAARDWVAQVLLQ